MKIKNVFSIRKWIIYCLGKKVAERLSDKTYICLEFYAYLGRKLNLTDPKTFNEKLQWLKLFDHQPWYTQLVDKHEVKSIVARIIGEEYVVPELGVWDRPEEIDFDQLPDQFVLKVTHDSGGLVICRDKKKIYREQVMEKMNRSLRRDYYHVHREWPYKNVPKRIVAETLLDDGNNELRDYKLMCFNGKVRATFVCSDRFSADGLKVTFFDNSWKRMPFERHYRCSQEPIEQPKSFELMIRLAEKLSKGIPFVRVDFYEVDGKPYFGEMTFFPGSGYEEFTPAEYDKLLGSWIKLPTIQKHL